MNGTRRHLNRSYGTAEKARHRRAFSAGWDGSHFRPSREAASVRVPRPKICKLACKAKGAGTFAEGEYTAEGVGSVDRFEPAKRLKCLQNCGIMMSKGR